MNKKQTKKMKKNTKKRALVLSLAMAAMLAMPTMASAQESRSNYGGLFGTAPTSKNAQGGMLTQGNISRDASAPAGLSLDDPTHNDPSAPLGSGLMILMVAGAGYVALKKKED